MKLRTQKSLFIASSIVALFTLAASAQAATILNLTTFNGTETTSDGNVSGYGDSGSSNFDTVNGWTWGTINSTTPATQGVFSGLSTIKDQEIRVGAGLELITGSGGSFFFGWGGSNTHIALAQTFTTVNLGDTISITYDLAGNAGMKLYIDSGDGTYTADHNMINGTNTYSFDVATTTTFRIAVRGNDGADSNASLNSIQVSAVPEPGVLGLISGLGGLALLRRRRA